MPETLAASLPGPLELRALLEEMVLKDLLGPVGGEKDHGAINVLARQVKGV